MLERAGVTGQGINRVMDHAGKPQEAVDSDFQDILREKEGKYSSLQSFFLRRLNKLLQLRQEQSSQLNGDGLRLLDQAIFSTYCDCVDLGVGAKAQKLIHQQTVSSQNRPDN